MDVEYKPCNSCDGWLMTNSRGFTDNGEYYETVINWLCYTCGNSTIEQSRDVPKRDAPERP